MSLSPSAAPDRRVWRGSPGQGTFAAVMGAIVAAPVLFGVIKLPGSWFVWLFVGLVGPVTLLLLSRAYNEFAVRIVADAEGLEARVPRWLGPFPAPPARTIRLRWSDIVGIHRGPRNYVLVNFLGLRVDCTAFRIDAGARQLTLMAGYDARRRRDYVAAKADLDEIQAFIVERSGLHVP